MFSIVPVILSALGGEGCFGAGLATHLGQDFELRAETLWCFSAEDASGDEAESDNEENDEET